LATDRDSTARWNVYNLDADKGQYNAGYSDDKVAKETGISLETIKKTRIDGGFGKLRPPTELDQAKRQLDELETAFLRMDSELRNGIKDLKARILQLQKRFD
jgi:transposase